LSITTANQIIWKYRTLNLKIPNFHEFVSWTVAVRRCNQKLCRYETLKVSWFSLKHSKVSKRLPFLDYFRYYQVGWEKLHVHASSTKKANLKFQKRNRNKVSRNSKVRLWTSKFAKNFTLKIWNWVWTLGPRRHGKVPKFKLASIQKFQISCIWFMNFFHEIWFMKLFHERTLKLFSNVQTLNLSWIWKYRISVSKSKSKFQRVQFPKLAIKYKSFRLWFKSFFNGFVSLQSKVSSSQVSKFLKFSIIWKFHIKKSWSCFSSSKISKPQSLNSKFQIPKLPSSVHNLRDRAFWLSCYHLLRNWNLFESEQIYKVWSSKNLGTIEFKFFVTRFNLFEKLNKCRNLGRQKFGNNRVWIFCNKSQSVWI
jgi:hypothetical protein